MNNRREKWRRNIVQRLFLLAEEEEMANDEMTEHHSEYSFYVSDAAEKFRKFANTVMPFDVPTTNVVNIEEY